MQNCPTTYNIFLILDMGGLWIVLRCAWTCQFCCKGMLMEMISYINHICTVKKSLQSVCGGRGWGEKTGVTTRRWQHLSTSCPPGTLTSHSVVLSVWSHCNDIYMKLRHRKVFRLLMNLYHFIQKIQYRILWEYVMYVPVDSDASH